MTLSATFDVHGFMLEVQADNQPLMDVIDLVLGPFAVSGAAPEHVTAPFGLTLHEGEPQWNHDLGMKLLWQGTLVDGSHMICHWEGSRRRIALRDRAVAEFDLGERRAEITCRPGAYRSLRGGCLLPILCEAMATIGHYAVHSAVLAGTAADGSRRAAIISGVSGRGKTTTSLALAHAGFELLADDTCFIHAGPAGVAAWGLRMPCKVHPNTLALLPWLNELSRTPATTPPEFMVDTSGFAGAGAAEALVSAVVCLEPRNDDRHLLTPMDKAAALVRLVKENVRIAEPQIAAAAKGTFEAMSRLIASCPVYTLSVGPDIDSLALMVRGLLEA